LCLSSELNKPIPELTKGGAETSVKDTCLCWGNE
jgi:hypothetical protein